jgi:hypothetical protein
MVDGQDFAVVPHCDIAIERELGGLPSCLARLLVAVPLDSVVVDDAANYVDELRVELRQHWHAVQGWGFGIGVEGGVWGSEMQGLGSLVQVQGLGCRMSCISMEIHACLRMM